MTGICNWKEAISRLASPQKALPPKKAQTILYSSYPPGVPLPATPFFIFLVVLAADQILHYYYFSIY
jgi:hypothetical protein